MKINPVDDDYEISSILLILAAYLDDAIDDIKSTKEGLLIESVKGGEWVLPANPDGLLLIFLRYSCGRFFGIVLTLKRLHYSAMLKQS